MRQVLIERVGQRGGDAVVHFLGGGDNDLDVGGEEAFDLGLGGAGVEKDKLQAALFGQKGGETAAVDALKAAGAALEEQLVAVGMAAVVEDGDAPLEFWMLKGRQNIIERGVVAQLELAQALRLGIFQGSAHLPCLFGQVAQVIDAIGGIVGKGQQDHRLVGCRNRHRLATPRVQAGTNCSNLTTLYFIPLRESTPPS